MSDKAFILKRSIILASLDCVRIAQLSALPAVKKVKLKPPRIIIFYDASELQWSIIAELLDCQSSWITQKKHQWYGFVDANADKNDKDKNVHCCNKVPSIYR